MRQSSCIDNRVEARCTRFVAKTSDDKKFEVVTVDGELVFKLYDTYGFPIDRRSLLESDRSHLQ